MATKPMLILLDTLFRPCLVDGTHVCESGLKVSTEVLPNEKILFFHIDSNIGRINLNLIEPSSRICDYLILYTKDSSNQETVCFLEFKGKKQEDAIKQIISTYTSTLTISKAHISKEQLKDITWKACICMHGQAPRGKSSNTKELIKRFGKDNICIKHGTKHFKLLGPFLREKTS